MTNNCKMKVGDKVVEVGGVFRVFKIKKKKNLKNKLEDYIFYKPFFQHRDNKTLVCSIPIVDIEKIDMRRPATKEKMTQALRLLSKKLNGEAAILVMEAQTLMKRNKPLELAKVLRRLWIDKQDESRNFSLRKKTAFERGMRSLTEEIAVVYGIGLRIARKKVMNGLEKVVS